jgi:hypothetical protein
MPVQKGLHKKATGRKDVTWARANVTSAAGNIGKLRFKLERKH